VEYIGAFADTIYTDVDKDTGVGSRKFDGFTVLTSKYIYQMRSKRDDGDYFEFLSEYHRRLKVSVKEAWDRKEVARIKREAKVNAVAQ
jgi:hypothetical protein